MEKEQVFTVCFTQTSEHYVAMHYRTQNQHREEKKVLLTTAELVQEGCIPNKTNNTQYAGQKASSLQSAGP